MNILAASSTKEVIHIGKRGNVYQLDSIVNQLEIESSLAELGYFVDYVGLSGNEDEAIGLVETAHDNNYLDVFRATPKEVAFLSNGLMLQPCLYKLALEHALIAKKLVDLAFDNKIVFSTVGGGHHCQKDKPLGFGLVNTMAISAIYARTLGCKVALIDLDTHYSNGCNEILLNKENVLVTSLWNQVIPAWKYFDKQDNLYHKKVVDKADYFDKLGELLNKVKEFGPTMIIYHLGFDVLETDRMGGVKGMDEVIFLDRERIVKDFFGEMKIPCVIYRGGGYTKYDGDVNSIKMAKRKHLEVEVKAITSHFV